MRRLHRILLFLWLIFPGVQAAWAQPSIDFGRYHALVIGNDAYRHLPRLKTAGADARALANLLRARYGFQVELLLDADRDQLVRAVNRYRAALKDGDNLLIYYAGHGLIDEATDRGFWLPVDAEPGNEARWLDIAVVTSNLRAMQARHILVIADSCYSGSLVRAANDAGLATGGDVLLQRMRERRARLALTSGSLEPVADGGGSGHSVFAKALLKVLRENAEILSGSDLFTRLRSQVIANARQTPLYADIRFAGHEGGDFIFVPTGADLAAAASPAPNATDIKATMELAFWNAIRDSSVGADYQAYLDAFPAGQFAPIARRRAETAGPAAAALTAKPPVKALPAAASTQPAIADADQLKDQWNAVRERLRQQYDRDWAIVDQTSSLGDFGAYRVQSISPDEIVLSLDYRAVNSAQGTGLPESRTAIVRVGNRAPQYRILQWGRFAADVDPADARRPREPIRLSSQEDAERLWPVIRRALERQYMDTIRTTPREFQSTSWMSRLGGFPEDMRVRSHRLVALDEAVMTFELTYEIAWRSADERREARVVLRNSGPDFEIVEWKR